jgi:hypothetical protein
VAAWQSQNAAAESRFHGSSANAFKPSHLHGIDCQLLWHNQFTVLVCDFTLRTAISVWLRLLLIRVHRHLPIAAITFQYQSVGRDGGGPGQQALHCDVTVADSCGVPAGNSLTQKTDSCTVH